MGRMPLNVFSLRREYHKIFRVIIPSVSINMMNYLALTKWPPENLLRHKAVLMLTKFLCISRAIT